MLYRQQKVWVVWLAVQEGGRGSWKAPWADASVWKGTPSCEEAAGRRESGQ